MNINTTEQLRNLRRKLSAHFDWSELQILSFDLSVDWSSLSGDTIELKSQSLISYMGRRGRLSDLVVLLREERPNVDWAYIPLAEEQLEIAFGELLSQYIQMGQDLILSYDIYERKRILRVIGIIESKLEETESQLTQMHQALFKEAKHQLYRDYQKVLFDEYEVVFDQMGYSLEAVSILRMKRQAAVIEEELRRIEKILSD